MYQIDWGVTETLVAEGLTREAIGEGRAGVISRKFFQCFEAQLEGLEMVTEYVRDQVFAFSPPLSSKELHALITQNTAVL